MCQRQGCGRGDEKTSVAVRPAGATDQPLPPFDHVAARARAARNACGLAFDRHRAVPLECGVRHMQQPRERPHDRQMQKHLRGQACGAPSRAGSAALLLPPPPSRQSPWYVAAQLRPLTEASPPAPPPSLALAAAAAAAPRRPVCTCTLLLLRSLLLRRLGRCVRVSATHLL